MNGYLWHTKFVNANSSFLIDRTGQFRVATTDPNTLCIYLSEELQGDFLRTVLLHELGHCVMFSYDLLDKIHRLVPRNHWIEIEELICNFFADYGLKIFTIAYDILGENAWKSVPYELERLIS